MTKQEQRLERQVADLRTTLGALIAWMVQSANSPINHNDAKQLLRMLEGDAE